MRQSVLAQFDNCSFAGKLAFEQGQNNEDSPQSHATNRGTLFHMFAEQATSYMVANHESGPVTGDVARTMAQAVMLKRSPDYPIPAHEQEAIRLMAWNFGEGHPLNMFPIRVLEERYQLEINDFMVYGTPDLVEEIEPGVLLVTDYKTSLTIPSQEDYERKFQPPFYAVLVAHGHSFETGERLTTDAPIKRVITREVYPRYTNSDGDLAERVQEFNQEQMADFMVALETVVARVEQAFETDNFPAVPGNHCGFCPDATQCPILNNPYRETPTSMAEAKEMAEAWHRKDAERKRIFNVLRDYAKEHGSIELNDTHELGFKSVTQEEVINKDALKSHLWKGGHTPGDFFKTRTSTRFGLRKKES